MTTGRDELRETLERTLRGALGGAVLPEFLQKMRPRGRGRLAPDTSYRSTLILVLIYLLLFALAPWLIHLALPRTNTSALLSLTMLQIYGGLWAGWNGAILHLVSKTLMRIIRDEILPALSSDEARMIAQDLTMRFSWRNLLRDSWAEALCVAAIAGLLIQRDTHAPIGFVIWWTCGWTFLLAKAAKVLRVATFYRAFTRALAERPGDLFPLDAVSSSRIAAVATLGRIMLIFWLSVAVSIMLIVPFAVRDWHAWFNSAEDVGAVLSLFFAMPRTGNSFVVTYMLFMGCCLIGFGVGAFLTSEADIRRGVRRVTAAALARVEAAAGSDFERLGDLDEAGRKRLEFLRALHVSLAGASSYRGWLVSALSLLLPFLPLISLVLGRMK